MINEVLHVQQKDVFFLAVFSRAWDREKLFSLHEELNLRLADSAL